MRYSVSEDFMERFAILRVHVVDSHTGGEPTRLVVEGGPNLGSGSLAERREIFRSQHDKFRSAVVNEPRGSDNIVGALLCEPFDKSCTAGIIFFNNVGYLSMCGHGTIGLVATLAFLGKIQPGEHRIETPIGVVTTWLHPDGAVTIENVPSYRYAKAVRIDVPGYGTVTGDIAWGGNWFFLIGDHGREISSKNIDQLTEYAWAVRQTLIKQDITGANGQEIDHIELFGPPQRSDADVKNFVLCPGMAYDRSPCGTGTSAKLACLYADGKLKEGQTWRQESIIGSMFEGFVKIKDEKIYPHIKGSAFVNAESTLLLDPRDPFNYGIHL
jgi:4-hydroxyproline epimerase